MQWHKAANFIEYCGHLCPVEKQIVQIHITGSFLRLLRRSQVIITLNESHL